MTTATVSPACLAIALRMADRTGNLCVPSPRAMNDERNAWPSTVPRTLTSPTVPKNSADPGITTYVQPPLEGLCWRTARNLLGRAATPTTILGHVSKLNRRLTTTKAYQIWAYK